VPGNDLQPVVDGLAVDRLFHHFPLVKEGDDGLIPDPVGNGIGVDRSVQAELDHGVLLFSHEGGPRKAQITGIW